MMTHAFTPAGGNAQHMQTHLCVLSCDTVPPRRAPSRHARVCAVQGSAGVLELASSTLAMFSSRAGAGAAFAEASTAPVLIKLLSPLFPPAVVLNATNTIGSMAGAWRWWCGGVACV